MFGKLIGAVVLTVIAAAFPETRGYAVWVFFIGVSVAFVIEGVRIVPQQYAYVVERLGRFHGVLEPGLNLIIPFLDRVAYMHSLKEVPLDVPEQVCITKDNTQLAVDGVIYFQVTDPRLASYDRVEQRSDLILVADVDRVRVGFDSLGAQLDDGFFESLDVARRDDDPGTEAAELARGRKADSGTPARDERELPGEQVRCKNRLFVQGFALEQQKNVARYCIIAGRF